MDGTLNLERYNKVCQECLTICPITEAQLMGGKARYKPSTEEEVEYHERSLPAHDEYWQVDENGVLLMAMTRNAALLPWSGDKGKEVLNVDDDRSRNSLFFADVRG